MVDHCSIPATCCNLWSFYFFTTTRSEVLRWASENHSAPSNFDALFSGPTAAETIPSGGLRNRKLVPDRSEERFLRYLWAWRPNLGSAIETDCEDLQRYCVLSVSCIILPRQQRHSWNSRNGAHQWRNQSLLHGTHVPDVHDSLNTKSHNLRSACDRADTRWPASNAASSRMVSTHLEWNFREQCQNASKHTTWVLDICGGWDT